MLIESDRLYEVCEKRDGLKCNEAFHGRGVFHCEGSLKLQTKICVAAGY